jgi:prolipoprotein diacylglyceryltransferase
MTDGPEWFAPKRYGYGSGLPISWQGWLVTIGFLAIVFTLVFALRERPMQLVAALVPITLVFMVIAARTTKGGWRWRWGDSDEDS